MEKQIKNILFYSIITISIGVIIYAMTYIISTNPSWFKDMAIYSMAVTITSIVMMVIVWISKHRQEKGSSIYISYSEDYVSQARRIVNMLQRKFTVYSASHIFPGSNIYDTIPAYIGRCQTCYVIIGKKMSTMQKYEIATMVSSKKNVIPVLLSTDIKLPQNLRSRKPILYSDLIHNYLRHV